MAAVIGITLLSEGERERDEDRVIDREGELPCWSSGKRRLAALKIESCVGDEDDDNIDNCRLSFVQRLLQLCFNFLSTPSPLSPSCLCPLACFLSACEALWAVLNIFPLAFCAIADCFHLQWQSTYRYQTHTLTHIHTYLHTCTCTQSCVRICN